MARSRCVLTFFFFLCESLAFAQQQTYFVQFRDKGSNTFSITQPEQFLTAKALQRRQKCKVLVDEKDLPVSQIYIDQIQSTGAQLLYPVKWLNGVVVRSDATVKSQIALLSFVQSADQSIKYRTTNSSATQQSVLIHQTFSSCTNDYSFRQKDMLGMVKMKNDGYNGSGILIAITDDGFLHADTMKVFEDLYNNNQIIDTWDIVDLDKNTYAQGGGHGAAVFSILGGSLTTQFLGPGHGADFILFRTEDTGSESPLEELNWIRAAEMADSLGTDIIQVSLGYNTFDDSSLDYTQSDLNGETSYISRGADVAATRGIVVVVSAGNDGNNSWGKILCPADAKGILSVGAVDANEDRAAFSSIGYSADGRVKPDLMAMGANVTYVSSATGNIAYGSGTSFASPLISGLCSGLMQAYPQLTHEELIRAVKYSADRFEEPNAYYGYGIPNYEKASAFARLLLDKESELVFPNPFDSHVYIKIREEEVGYLLNWKLYTVTGELLGEGDVMPANSLVNLFSNGEALSAGLYCLKTSCNGHFSTFKLIK